MAESTSANAGVAGGRMPFASRFRQRLDELGPGRAAYWYLMSALARFAGLHVHRLTIDSGFRELRFRTPPSTPPGYETRFVTARELRCYVGRTPGLTAEFVARAIDQDYQCVANFHRGEMVGYSFSSHSRAPVTPQLDIIVPTGFRYGFKAWTHPDHRRRKLGEVRIYTRVMAGVDSFGERSIGYVETHNYPSLLDRYRHPRERRIAMGYVGWITVFGRQIPFNSRTARWLGALFVRREDQRVRLYAR